MLNQKYIHVTSLYVVPLRFNDSIHAMMAFKWSLFKTLKNQELYFGNFENIVLNNSCKVRQNKMHSEIQGIFNL